MMNSIKKIIGLLCSVIFFISITISIPQIAKTAEEEVNINEENFPDKIFRDYVKLNFDINQDKKLSNDEIAKATWILMQNKGVKSFHLCGWIFQ